jgi:hypothetical protein
MKGLLKLLLNGLRVVYHRDRKSYKFSKKPVQLKSKFVD